MSILKAIKTFFAKTFGQVDDHIEDAAEEFGEFIGSASDRIVSALKQTEVGTAAANIISAVENDDAYPTGGDKFEYAVGEVAPLIVDFITSGGFPALLDDVEDLARQLIQSTYNDAQSTSFGKVLSPLLKLLGIIK